MLALGRFGIEAKAEKLPGKIFDGRACQGGDREELAALVHHHEVAVAIDLGIDQIGRFNNRDATRA
jgi:hypothetical protein